MLIAVGFVGSVRGETARHGVPPVVASVAADQVSGKQSLESVSTSLHLEVGKTLILNSISRISRVYVANPKVLGSHVVSPHQVLLTANEAGLTSVLFWDEANHASGYEVSSDLEVEPVRKAIGEALPAESPLITARGSRIFLEGSVASQGASDTAERIARLFTKDVVNSILISSAKARQVELKVRFIEVDRARLSQFGINIFAPGGSSSVGSGSTQQFPSTATLASGGSTPGLLAGSKVLAVTNPLSFLFYSTRTNVGVTVQDLENKQVLQVLAEPTITTLSGNAASFLAGGEFPFPVVQGNTSGSASVTVQFRPFGVKLGFLPKVNIDGSIDLKVSPEVSALDYTNAVSISGYTIPALSTKHVETEVVLRSGQSFAISGLLDHRTTDALSRTPGIASIPFLGALFRSKNVNLSTSELIVIVTPTVVDPLSEATVPSEPGTVRPFLNEKKFDPAFAAHAKP